MTKKYKPGPDASLETPPAAKNLIEYLCGSQAAKPFLTNLEKGDAQLPTEEERDEIVSKAVGDFVLATKLGELIRIAAAEETAGRTKKILMVLGSEYIRAQSSDLRNWSLIATASSETDLGMLARNVRRARESGDKGLIGKAELALTTGLSIISTRADFSIVGATTILAQQLFPEPLEPHQAEKTVRKALRRASSKNLETYSAIARAHSGAVEECRKRSASLFAELGQARESLKDCNDARSASEQTIRELNEELRAVRSELEGLEGRIAGVKGGAADDITRLKARVRQFYRIKLQEALSTADEALSLEPPSFRVARERVRDVLGDVRKELEWLDQS